MQLTNSQATQVARAQMTLQMIAGALIMGAVSFLMITVVVNFGKDFQWTPDILEFVGLAAGVGGLMGGVVVVPILKSQRAEKLKQEFREALAQRSKGEEWSDSQVEALLGEHQSFTVIRYGILEGAGFMNLVVFLVGQGIVPLVMAGILLLSMFGIFPRRDHFNRLLDVTPR
jgi:ammonia channel protein AmtB